MSKKFLYLNLIILSLIFSFDILPMFNSIRSIIFSKDSNVEQYSSNQDKLLNLSTKIKYEKEYLQSTSLGTGAIFAASSAYFVKGLFNVDDFKKIGVGISIVGLATYFGWKHGNKIKHEFNPFSVNIDKLEIQYKDLNESVEKDTQDQKFKKDITLKHDEALTRLESLNRKFDTQGKKLDDQTALIQKLQEDNIVLTESIESSKQEVTSLVDKCSGKSLQAIQEAKVQIQAISSRIEEAAAAMDEKINALGDRCEKSVLSGCLEMKKSLEITSGQCKTAIENLQLEMHASERRVKDAVGDAALSQARLVVAVAVETDRIAGSRQNELLAAINGQKSIASSSTDQQQSPAVSSIQPNPNQQSFRISLPFYFGGLAGSRLPYLIQRTVQAIEGTQAASSATFQDNGSGTGQ